MPLQQYTKRGKKSRKVTDVKQIIDIEFDFKAGNKVARKFNEKGYAKKLIKAKEIFLKDYDKLSDMKDQIESLIKTLEMKYSWFNGDSILDSIQLVLNNEFSEFDNILVGLDSLTENGFVSNNLAIELSNLKAQLSAINDQMIKYANSYELLFNNLNDTIDLLEEGSQALRKDNLIQQIGILDKDGFYKEFFADAKTMEQLRRDREFMKIQVGIYKKDKQIKYETRNGQTRARQTFALKVRETINEDTFFESLQKVISAGTQNGNIAFLADNPQLNNQFQNYLAKNMAGQLLTKKGEKLGLGRLNELFMLGRLSGDPQRFLDNFIASGARVNLDNLKWIYGGDQNFFIENNNQRINFNMSQKMISFDEKGQLVGYGFNISSLNTAIEGAQMWEENVNGEPTIQNKILEKYGYQFEERFQAGNYDITQYNSDYINATDMAQNELIGYMVSMISDIPYTTVWTSEEE